jgi:hypothetical protein
MSCDEIGQHRLDHKAKVDSLQVTGAELWACYSKSECAAMKGQKSET